MAENEQLEQVIPSNFTLMIKGKKREIKFGNLALAKIERKYGSVTNFAQLEKAMNEKPMETIPWLLSICMKDKSDIGDEIDDILIALDESNLLILDVAEILGTAMNSAMSNLMSNGKKKATKKK